VQTNSGLLDELENVYVKGQTAHSHASRRLMASTATLTCSNAVGSSDAGGHGADTQIRMRQVGARCSMNI
jgi:hypothetical protein